MMFCTSINFQWCYLEQEPQLTPGKTVQEIVNEGVAEQQAKLDRYDQIWELLGNDLSEEEADKLNNEVAALQEEIDSQNLWELDRQVEMAMDALRLPESASPLGGLSLCIYSFWDMSVYIMRMHT